jgi:hypothetical protein
LKIIVEDRVRSKSVYFLLFKGEKHVQKSLNKIRPQSPKEKLSRYGAPVFAPNYSTTGLATKM